MELGTSQGILLKGGPMSQHPLSILPIQTSLYSPSENLSTFLVRHLQRHSLENKILAITSKIVSLAEGRTVSKTKISKEDLIRQEADLYLGPGNHGIELTITQGLLIPSAGIDESNSADGDYILFPQDPYASAKKIWESLTQQFQLKNLGIIITDSHSMPLRKGVTGIGLSHWGFKAVRSLVGQSDLYQKPLKFTSVDILDALATAAVFTMGEADDRCPLALIDGAKVEFTNSSSWEEIGIRPEDDLYAPLLKHFLP